MTIPAGTRLGRYEVRSLLGKGGMGEVYCAKDPELGRTVAVKVLSSRSSISLESFARFKQEAYAASSLNHPNVLTVYDVGTHDGSPYIISELLEGETLRERLNSSTLSRRKAIDYALQVARGLAAAHGKGIVHRDLKPENIFITQDERVKIIDFGLAKLAPAANGDQSPADVPTQVLTTDSNAVVGTVAYMSPEQVRGKAVDHRSDIFSFGVTLYEILTGRRVFEGESVADTIGAILRDDPPNLSAVSKSVSPLLERIVSHCLEKNPEERFQSARDLIFNLELLSAESGTGATVQEPAPGKQRRQLLPALLGLALLAVLALGSFFVGKRAGQQTPPSFRQLTFRRGTVRAARFAPGGDTIIYDAVWEGRSGEVFTSGAESTESRPLGLTGAGILAVSSREEIAVLLNYRNTDPQSRIGTLARVPLVGGAPREILENVQWADWSADGKDLAVVRVVEGRSRLEFPIGKVLYETSGWVSSPRISPTGDQIAFLDHPTLAGDRGSVAVVDLSGNKKTLSSGWTSESGLAWAPSGGEIWFTATAAGGNAALYAVTLSGRQRPVASVAGRLDLYDISRDGHVLLARESERHEMIGLLAGETKERDLSWLDQSNSRDLSADGKTLLFDERGEGGGAAFSVYLRKMDSSAAVRLGEGAAMALSPDGKWALSFRPFDAPPRLVLLPTGPGEAQILTSEGIDYYHGASWLPGGKQILFVGNEKGRGLRCYVQNLADGKARPVTPEGVTGTLVSLDGKSVVATDQGRRFFLYPIEGEGRQPIPGLDPSDIPVRWSADGRSLYIFRRGELPARVYRFDLATGRKELWKELMPSDPAGVDQIESVLLTPDGKTYVYTFRRSLSDLYVLERLN